MKYKALVDIRGAFNMAIIKKGSDFDIVRLEYYKETAYVWTSIKDAQDSHAVLNIDLLSNSHIIKVNYE